MTASPPGIVQLTLDQSRLTAHTLAPGLATIRMTVGGIERTRTLRVVSIEDVVSGSVRLRADPVCVGSICSSADSDLVGSVPSQPLPEQKLFTLAWTLRDGTLALGGAGRLRVTTTGATVLATGATGHLPADLELMTFVVATPDGLLCHRGPHILDATMGSARLNWTFEQKCP